MSWGIDFPSYDGSGYFIDQDYAGFFFEEDSPKTITQVDRNSPPNWPYTGGPYPNFANGTFAHLPVALITPVDILFCRPNGPLGWGPYVNSAEVCIQHGTGFGASGSIRTPCTVLHYKNLAFHTRAATGWGLVINTAAGEHAFNSSAHKKRLNIRASGVVSASSPGAVTTEGSRYQIRILSPGDNIDNYYALISNCARSQLAAGGVTGAVVYPVGPSYQYRYNVNEIWVEAYEPFFYCLAQVVG